MRVDLADPRLWDRLSATASDLVDAHQAAAEEAGAAGPDAAWRALMHDILSATTGAFDDDWLAAAGALAEALEAVSAQQPA